MASICVHVNPQQAVRAFIEADAYPGAEVVAERFWVGFLGCPKGVAKNTRGFLLVFNGFGGFLGL